MHFYLPFFAAFQAPHPPEWWICHCIWLYISFGS